MPLILIKTRTSVNKIQTEIPSMVIVTHAGPDLLVKLHVLNLCNFFSYIFEQFCGQANFSPKLRDYAFPNLLFQILCNFEPQNSFMAALSVGPFPTTHLMIFLACYLSIYWLVLLPLSPHHLGLFIT